MFALFCFKLNRRPLANNIVFEIVLYNSPQPIENNEIFLRSPSQASPTSIALFGRHSSSLQIIEIVVKHNFVVKRKTLAFLCLIIKSRKRL